MIETGRFQRPGGILKKVTAIAVFYLLLFISLAYAAYIVVDTSSSSMHRYNAITGQTVKQLNILLNLRQEADAIQLATLRMIFNTEADDVQGERDNIGQFQIAYERNWLEYKQSEKSASQKALFDSLQYYRQRDQEIRAQLMALCPGGNKTTAQAIDLYYTVQKPAYETYQSMIDRLTVVMNVSIHDELAATNSVVSSSYKKVNELLLFSFLTMVAGGIALTLHHRKLMKVKNQLLCEREQKQAEIALQTMIAQERERQQLGRELHDNVNQILAVARINLSLIMKYPEQTDVLVPKTADHLNEAVEEIRCISKSLVGPLSRNLSLRRSIEELATKMQPMENAIKFNLHILDINEDRLSADIKLAVYRILQEQVNNILKHANASIVDIHLEMTTQNLILKVADNGRGFDMSQVSKGIGLSNIANRAAAFCGSAQFNSTPGNGCTLLLRLPVSGDRVSILRPFYRRIASIWF